jgi:diguanylate cyclase with GGDEF domain
LKEVPLHSLLVDNDRTNGCLLQAVRSEMGSIRCELAHADRLGGDEFGVLTWEDSGQSVEFMVSRLLQHVGKSNTAFRHTLSLSLGRFDPTRTSSVEELMARADEALTVKSVANGIRNSAHLQDLLNPRPRWRDTIFTAGVTRPVRPIIGARDSRFPPGAANR